MKTLNMLAVISITGTLFGFGATTLAGDNLPISVEVVSNVVTFYDLDLAKPADAQKLLHRIRAAVKDACRVSSDQLADIHAIIDRNRCLDTSFKDTVAQVDSRFNTSIEKIAAMAGEQRGLVSKR